MMYCVVYLNNRIFVVVYGVGSFVFRLSTFVCRYTGVAYKFFGKRGKK